MEQVVIDSPIGKLGFVLRDGRLSRLDFLPAQASLVPPTGRRARLVVSRLRNYFKDPATSLQVDYAVRGTAYQLAVWAFLRTIPAGTILTYKQVSERVGGSPRSVGNACRANPVPLLTPCHRVVSSRGIGGFSGQSSGPLLQIKHWLLAHELGKKLEFA